MPEKCILRVDVPSLNGMVLDAGRVQIYAARGMLLVESRWIQAV